MNCVGVCPCDYQDHESLGNSSENILHTRYFKKVPLLHSLVFTDLTYNKVGGGSPCLTHHRVEEELEHAAIGSITSSSIAPHLQLWYSQHPPPPALEICKMESQYRKGKCESTTALP